MGAGAPAFETTRRDHALGVRAHAGEGVEYFPVWASAAQAPAMRSWPPYNDLRGQRRWERFWRYTVRWWR